MGDLEGLDFRALERELAAAVAADQKYQRENDAKFRAIYQKVSSYEEFRDIVLASDLKPLDRADKIGGDRKQPWNQPAETATRHPPVGTNPFISQEEPISEPRNALEFTRDWRRLRPDSRFHFLLQLGAEKLSRLFHAEVSSGLLGEFIIVLEQNMEPDHSEPVLKILQSLAQTQRFDLNLAFLSMAERESCKKLFGCLQPNQKEALESLMSRYKINEK
ncbi:dynein axonemal assembly factor 19 [Discoglossus pictus]